MRLTPFEIISIKQTFSDLFGDGEVYLFGSRVDDLLRGGDIDLYLCPSQKFDDERRRKINFLIKLESLIGEQKIDVVMYKNKDRLIEKEAINRGILL